ncbi:hypothetical protein COOONC_14463 [Cooperia oncophora]
MYPIIAHNVADNRLYHQPLRFLWTHAVEPRLLVPDSSSSPCFCTAPMILPPIEGLASVELIGPGVEEVHFDLLNEDRKRDLVEILTTGHGRVPVTVTESCLDDNELAQQEDWTLRQIFDHRVERPCCKVTKVAKELERMKITNHPGGPGDLRWRSIDSAPAIRQYLKTLHMVCRFHSNS